MAFIIGVKHCGIYQGYALAELGPTYAECFGAEGDPRLFATADAAEKWLSEFCGWGDFKVISLSEAADGLEAWAAAPGDPSLT
jgi:hypothetical protein